MTLNVSAVGSTTPPWERGWSSQDAILYALGVGAGVDDLAFTTGESSGITQLVLPTMAVALEVPGRDRIDALGPIDRTKLVHGEQGITIHQPIPVQGTVQSVSTITGIYDKGSGALVTTEVEAVAADTGARMWTSRSAVFIRGYGGWGGDRGPTTTGHQCPDRSPDHVVSYRTSLDQALLYRLSGDLNPLHSDPEYARAAGFSAPILHGLCTYGFTGRALLAEICGNNPLRFRHMSARFSAAVWPGDALTVEIWEVERGAAAFRTRRNGQGIVIDNGLFLFDPTGGQHGHL